MSLMSLLDSIESRPQVPSIGTILRLFNDALTNRLNLAALELEESREHAAVSALLAGIVLCLVIFAGFAFTLMVAALVWESPHRAAWLAGLTGSYVLIAAIIGFCFWRRMKAWRPFVETKSQLHQDQQCLQDLTKSFLQ